MKIFSHYRRSPLADYRREKDISRERLARECGISYALLKKIEMGEKSIDDLKKVTHKLNLMKFYGVNPDEKEGFYPIMPFMGISKSELNYRIKTLDSTKGMTEKLGLPSNIIRKARFGSYNYDFIVKLCKAYGFSMSQFLSE